MKAKHAVARIKGMSAWQKLFCAIMAALMLSLMVPNGLYANAANVTDSNAKEVKIAEKSQDEVLKDFEETLNADAADNLDAAAGFMTLNSKLSFIPSSINAAETSGHFTSQKAGMTLLDYLSLRGGALPLNEEEFYGLFQDQKFVPAIAKWIAGLLAGYEETDVFGNVEDDLTNCLYIPEDIKQNRTDQKTPYQLNAIVYNNSAIIKDASNRLNDRWSDGSIYYITMTLGDGDIMNMLKTTTINATRLVPIIPAVFNYGPEHFNADNGLLGAENTANANSAAYFLNWSISLDGQNYLPLSMVDEMFELNGALKILPNTHYYLKANFYDAENMTLVHLDFSDAYVNGNRGEFLATEDEVVGYNGLPSLLRENYWYTTDFVKGSVWTKAYPNWLPTWYVISDIFETFGDAIFGNEGETKTNAAVASCPVGVYKDRILLQAWENQFHGDIDRSANIDDKPVYPGPHWVSIDNENWYGDLTQETTITFSVYPVSPAGHVVHNQPREKGTTISSLFDVPTPVYDADVIYYNQWGIPLFRHQNYGAVEMPGSPDISQYYFFTKEAVEPEMKGDLPVYENIYPEDYDWCFDTEIDHAVVYAHDAMTTLRAPQIYIPLRAEAANFDSMAAALYDYSYADFQVERLMFGGIETLMTNDNVASYDVTYLEDGQPLFDTFTISDPWELAMFNLPLVTNGTITTWRNTLVSGWNAYVDWMGPWGDVDPLTAFQDENNFQASDGNHWFQVRLTANPKPGCAFDSWYYDRQAFSADVEGAGEEPIIIHELAFYPQHVVRANCVPAAGAAIYGEDADNAAIYGTAANAATPDGNAATVNDGTAQTGDTAGFAFAILAMIAIAGAGVLAGRKLYNK